MKREKEKADISKGNKKYGRLERDNIFPETIISQIFPELVNNFTSNPTNSLDQDHDVNTFYGLETFKEDVHDLIIVEDINDYLAVKEHKPRYSVITINNYKYSDYQKKALLDILKEHYFTNIFIVFHTLPQYAQYHFENRDRQTQAEQLANFLYDHRLNARIHISPINGGYDKQYDDDSEYTYFKHSETLKEVIENEDQGLKNYEYDYSTFQKVLSGDYSELALLTLTEKHFKIHKFDQNFNIAKEVINNTKLWLDHTILYDYIEELEKYDFEYDEYTDRIKKYYNHFDEKHIPKLKKLLDEKPTEPFIRDQTLKHNNITYISEKGYFEYSNSIWHPIEYGDIRGLVSEECNNYETGKLLRDVQTLIDAKLRNENRKRGKQLEFNKKPLIVFNNGTYDLEKKILRQSNADDLATLKLNFDYDPHATAPRFLECLSIMLNNNQSSITLLKRFGGYILKPDHKEKKFLFLEGGTNSGKSSYLNILKALFNNDYSIVNYKGFNSQFSPSTLEDKWLNIDDDEQNTNFDIIPDFFNNYTAGEPIKSEQKHAQQRTIIARSKHIMTSNKPLTGLDFPEAILTRLVRVVFPMHFTDNPIKANDLAIDPNIIDYIIKNELQGVFNWFLEGYYESQELWQQGKHPLETAQNEKYKDFIRNGNKNFDTFIEDEKQAILNAIFAHDKHLINANDVLDLYKEYCKKYDLDYFEDKEHRRSYNIQIKKAFERVLPEFEKKQSNRKYIFRFKKNYDQQFKTIDDYLAYKEDQEHS